MVENPNRDKALQFLQYVTSGKIDEAYDQFVLSTGKHHSPHFAAGFESLKAAMKDNHQQFPAKQSEIKHVVAEDDLVAVHSRVMLQPGGPEFAIMHLFRFEAGKIVELWDFMQSAAEPSPNADGLF